MKKGIFIQVYSSGFLKPGWYKGIDVQSKKELFKNSFPCSSETSLHYVGAVHGLMYEFKSRDWRDVYVSNPIAFDSIIEKNYDNKDFFNHNADMIKMHDTIDRCKRWLANTSSHVTPERISQSDYDFFLLELEGKKEEPKIIDEKEDKEDKNGWWNKT